MRSSEEDIVLLENYLKGNLSEKEMVEVASRLAHEKDLGLDLQDLKTLSAGMRLNALKGKMDLLKGLEANRINQPKSGKSKYILGFSIILLVLGGYLIYTYLIKDKEEFADKQHFYAGNFDKELILHKTFRSSSENDSLTPLEKRGYDLYSVQLFEEAIPELEKLWNDNRDTLALFYLGVSNKAIGNNEEAKKIFQMTELKQFEALYNKLTN